jgi:hypothetical protein
MCWHIPLPVADNVDLQRQTGSFINLAMRAIAGKRLSYRAAFTEIKKPFWRR